MALLRLFGVASLFAGAIAQFVKPPTDLITTSGNGFTVRYKEVPGDICETTPGVKSYSGYVDVGPDQHLFFWFFETRTGDPTKAPTTIWLDGGPGDPSIAGLFADNGPCTIDADQNLIYNKYSWNNVSNMLYLDQPSEVGFSYSQPTNGYTDASTGITISVPGNTCPDYVPEGGCGTWSSGNYSLTANSTIAAAPNVWKAVQGLLGALPQYSPDIYLSTYSYGGHYGPVFTDYFLQQNAKGAGQHINLRGLSVGNGWVEPLINYPAYYNYTVSPGNTFDYKPYNASVAAQVYNQMFGKGNCIDQLKDCNTRGIDEICSSADAFCADVETIFDDITGRDEYDIRELSPDPFPPTYFVQYLNTPKVQKAIGAYVNFTYGVTLFGGDATSVAFTTTGDDARSLGIIGKIQNLLKNGIQVLTYAGDADYICNWIGGEAVAATINATGWKGAGYQNISTPDNIVHGVAKQSGNFTFARVYDSGHEVPFYQPQVALSMFERFIKNTDIATGKTKVTANYKSTGPAKSTYKNDNSTIQEDVTPDNCTYNVLTNVPDCPSS
ncbi:hypothetical protein LTR17_015171 [Elasticomyces elasticus]|nr:hypothetical protein LTR17_015171 [Elasticomyces elasticus]